MRWPSPRYPKKFGIKARRRPTLGFAEHLPRTAAPLEPGDLPEAVPGVESPIAYDWDAEARKIVETLGAEILPVFRLSTGASDHAQTLEACRVEAERLLKALRAKRYNVSEDYAEEIDDYLQALPTAAPVGNILLAYNRVLSLRDSLVENWNAAPAKFRNDLKRLIENNFALFRFYDAIERHQIAIASSKQVDVLPKAPVREFIAAVRAAPDVFAPSVEAGLRGVEALAPRPESERRRDETDAPPASLVPAPPLTPDAAKSADRQKAGAINALWKVVLDGPKIVGATDAWIDFAHKGAALVKPILDWLAGS